MIVKTKMCYSQLLMMLLVPEKFYKAVSSFTSTSPDMAGEGFNGYMEIEVVFEIKDLFTFSGLMDAAYVAPSDRPVFYHLVRDGKFFEYAAGWKQE